MLAKNAIEISNVVKKYNENVAVDHLNLKIKKGEIYGLLGPNGAGKSTTIFMLLGLTEPTEGELFIEGISPTINPIEVKRMVGFLPDHVGVYEDLTGKENLMLTAQLNGFSDKEANIRAEELLEQVGLSHAKHKKTGKYSRGMKQRLGFADTLIKRPSIIIMDEPTLGIDPKGIQDFLSMIRELRDEYEMTILLSSHHLHHVQQICDRVGIFVKGHLLAEGDLLTLQKQLLDDQDYLYELKASDPLEEVVSFVKTLPLVKDVSRLNEVVQIRTSQEIHSHLLKEIVNKGISVTAFNKISYGLDDIYQQYFQGGDNLGNEAQ